jgi:glutamate synthase (NADPH) small chain
MKETLSPKQRIKIPRADMPEQDAATRIHNFLEVNRGLEEGVARLEAERCLTCTDPKCVAGCPVGVKVRDFVQLVLDGDYLGAAAKVREDNVLPAVTGRVCPQEHQCEGACVMRKRVTPLAIGYLERFVADYERAAGQIGLPARAPLTGRKVAVIGSGPAGLSCAGDLSLRGHDVTVFEALHDIGGVLIYGIPEFRLPKEIVRQEVDNLRQMGVAFVTNTLIGKTITIEELLGPEGFDAVFIATGAGLPRFLNIPGEQLGGVYSANEFLTRVNLMHAYEHGVHDEPVYDCRDKTVVVVGGGNTAMDSVRSAKRLGARRAIVCYRRGRDEMPARSEELQHALAEGVELMTLTNPIEFLGDEHGYLQGMVGVRMALGEPDQSGRRQADPIPGSEFTMPIDVAIIAVGTRANPLVQASEPDLRTNRWGYIEVEQHSLRTSKRGVFAGGDIVSGAATVILAMGAGRNAAANIHAYLESGQW